jgi:hypothetical protein
MALRLIQPLREMSTKKLHRGKVRLARNADNLIASCRPALPVTEIALLLVLLLLLLFAFCLVKRIFQQ